MEETWQTAIREEEEAFGTEALAGFLAHSSFDWGGSFSPSRLLESHWLPGSGSSYSWISAGHDFSLSFGGGLECGRGS